MAASSDNSSVRIAILGFGNVGRALAERLESGVQLHGKPAEIAAVSDTSGGRILGSQRQLTGILRHKARGRELKDCEGSGRFCDLREFVHEVQQNRVHVVVESLPSNAVDGQPAIGWLTTMLRSGIPVVTVNKGSLVHGLDALAAAALEGGSVIAYSGTTGVKPPSQLRDLRVLEIRGILNGTTNYVLTEMLENARPFAEALKLARERGIAEPDPSMDLSGRDSACKLWILSRGWMGAQEPFDRVSRVGIGEETESLIRVARETGRVVRLIARARHWQGRIRLSVAPKVIGADSPFFEISGTRKGAVFRTREKGDIFVQGISSREAIAETILEDVAGILAR